MILFNSLTFNSKAPQARGVAGVVEETQEQSAGKCNFC